MTLRIPTFLFLFFIFFKVFAFELTALDIGQNFECFSTPRNHYDETSKLFISINQKKLCVFSVDQESGNYKFLFASDIEIENKHINDQEEQTLHLDVELKKLFISSDNGKLRIFDWDKTNNIFTLNLLLDETKDNLNYDRHFVISNDKRHLYFGAVNRIVVLDLENNAKEIQRIEIPNLVENEVIIALDWTPNDSILTVITQGRILTFERDFKNGQIKFINELVIEYAVISEYLGSNKLNKELFLNSWASNNKLQKFLWNEQQRIWLLDKEFLEGVMVSSDYAKYFNKNTLLQIRPLPDAKFALIYFKWNESKNDFIEIDRYPLKKYSKPNSLIVIGDYIYFNNRFDTVEKLKTSQDKIEFIELKRKNSFDFLGSISYVVWHPNGNFFYATEDGELTAFSFNKDNQNITRIQKVAPTHELENVLFSNGMYIISSDGKFLYSQNNQREKIHTYQIDSITGLLSEAQLSDIDESLLLPANTIALSPDNKYLDIITHDISSLIGGSAIETIELDSQTGLPIKKSEILVESWLFPETVKYKSDGAMMYLLFSNHGGSASGGVLQVISRDENGVLLLEQMIKFDPNTRSTSMDISANDKYLYVDTGAGIEIFNILEVSDHSGVRSPHSSQI